MLQKLAQIANELDEQGLFKEAEAVTSVMKRVAAWWNHKKDGPIRDFSPGDGGYKLPDFLDDMLVEGRPDENKELMQMHAVLKNYGIDTNGMSDDTIKNIYNAIMMSQQASAFASKSGTNTKLGS